MSDKPLYEKNVPYVLRDRKQFMCWTREMDEKGYMKKIPKSPITGWNADPTKPGNWADFKTACESARKNKFDGISLAAGKGIICIDIDHCVNPSDPKFSAENKRMADEIIVKLQSYTELSPSGNGIHIFLFGKIDNPELYYIKKDPLEIYTEKKVVTMTGNNAQWKQYKMRRAVDTKGALDEILDKYMTRPVKTVVTQNAPKTVLSFSDGEVIDLIRKGRSASKFNALYSGNASMYADRHHADLALVSMIAYYTQDVEQIDRIFRTSGLYREKWDDKRGNTTYGGKTIELALSNQLRRYDPDEAKEMAKRLAINSKKTAANRKLNINNDTDISD